MVSPPRMEELRRRPTGLADRTDYRNKNASDRGWVSSPGLGKPEVPESGGHDHERNHLQIHREHL